MTGTCSSLGTGCCCCGGRNLSGGGFIPFSACGFDSCGFGAGGGAGGRGGAIGGIAGVFFAVLKVPAAGWLKMTETRAKKRCAFEAAEPQWRKGGADEVATSHSTQAPPEHV